MGGVRLTAAVLGLASYGDTFWHWMRGIKDLSAHLVGRPVL